MERHWILGGVVSAAGLITLMIVQGTGERLAAFLTVATGWGLILWRLEVVFRAQIREMQEAHASVVELSREFHTVLDQFTDTFDDQFTKGKRELEQLCHLLRDAVERLTRTFTFFQGQIEAQQGLLEEVAGHSGSLMHHGCALATAGVAAQGGAGEADSGAALHAQTLVEEVIAMSDRLAVGVGQLWRVKGELDATLGEAVMALQFEDITTQLTTHVADRVAYLETLLRGVMKIGAGLGADPLDPGGARSAYQDRLRRMHEALAAASALVEQAEHVAVRQETLAAGEVELF